jgi:hypothetical protein
MTRKPLHLPRLRRGLSLASHRYPLLTMPKLVWRTPLRNSKLIIRSPRSPRVSSRPMKRIPSPVACP